MKDIVIPEAWKKVIKDIQVYFPQAVIAGGALRDLYHGKDIKDIDVFIPVSEPEDNLWVDQIRHLDYDFKTIQTNVYGQTGNEAMPGFRTLYAIYRIYSNIVNKSHPHYGWKEIPVELIFIQEERLYSVYGREIVKRVSDSFDINICQTEYNGEEVYFSPAFRYGVEHGVISPCNINRADRQEGRLKRMKDKYPEYTIQPVGDIDDLSFGN